MRRINIVLPILIVLLLLAAPLIAQAQTPVPSTPGANGGKATVQGLVVNMNVTDTSAADLEVMLHVFDATDQSDKGMLHGKTAQDGSYTISDVPFGEDLGYLAMAVYEGVAYQSEPQYAKEGKADLKIDIPVYESSPDTAKVQADQVHVLLNFASDGMEVKELYLLSNLGDHTVKEAVTLPDGKKATFRFPLPQDAQYIYFQTDNQERFVKFPGGFGDLQPLVPGTGTGQVLVSYLVPYTDPITYTYETTLATSNVSIILPEDSGVTLSGEGLGAGTTQTMPNNQKFVQYSLVNLTAGTARKITISGKPNITSSSPQTAEGSMTSSASTSSIPLMAGGGVLGISLVGVGIWWWRRSKREILEENQESSQDFDQVLTQIASLDKQHQDGFLSEKDYASRRAELMQQARILMMERDAAEK